MADGTMKGRLVLVTGATSGIGLETARQLAAMGARVVLGVRDPVRGADVARRIQQEGGEAEVLPIDLASFASVRDAAARFAKTHDRLDVLVNNAGIALPRREVSVDGHELTWQTNFLSHVLLTRLLLPSLSRGSKPRSSASAPKATGRDGSTGITSSSSGGMAGSGPTRTPSSRRSSSRGSSRGGGRTSCVNAVHPGAIATNIWKMQSRPVRGTRHRPGPAVRKAAPAARERRRARRPPRLGSLARRRDGALLQAVPETAPSTRASSDADAARLWSASRPRPPPAWT